MQNDLVGMITEAIGNDRITTREAAARMEGLFGYRCPDDMAKTLARHRTEGIIRGEISMDAGGWVWWVDDACRVRKEAGI